MNEKFEPAKLILGVNFHQDWDMDGAITDAEVMTEYKSLEKNEIITAGLESLKLLLELPDNELEKFVNYAVSYAYDEDGLTARQWIKRLIILLEKNDPSPA